MLIMMGNVVFSQVGIGTSTPNTSSDLDLGDTNKALYLNRVSDTSVINDPQPGMMVFDVSEQCVKAYQDSPAKWSGCMGSVSGTVSGLTCSSASFSPATATQGAVYTGTLTIPYTGEWRNVPFTKFYTKRTYLHAYGRKLQHGKRKSGL